MHPPNTSVTKVARAPPRYAYAATTDPLLSELLQSLSSGPTVCPALVLYPEDLALSVDLARFNDPPYVVVTSRRARHPTPTSLHSKSSNWLVPRIPHLFW